MPATFERKSITLETAQTVISGAAQKAQEIGVPMAIAVMDPDGTLKAFSRMDGAALLAVRIGPAEGLDRHLLQRAHPRLVGVHQG